MSSGQGSISCVGLHGNAFPSSHVHCDNNEQSRGVMVFGRAGNQPSRKLLILLSLVGRSEDSCSFSNTVALRKGGPINKKNNESRGFYQLISFVWNTTITYSKVKSSKVRSVALQRTMMRSGLIYDY